MTPPVARLLCLGSSISALGPCRASLAAEHDPILLEGSRWSLPLTSASVARLAFGALVLFAPAAAQSLPRRHAAALHHAGRLGAPEKERPRVHRRDARFGDHVRADAGRADFAQQIEHFVGTNTEIAAVMLRGLKQPPSLGDTAAYLHKKAALRDYTTKSYDYLLESLTRDAGAALQDLYAVQPARGARLAMAGSCRRNTRCGRSVS